MYPVVEHVEWLVLLVSYASSSWVDVSQFCVGEDRWGGVCTGSPILMFFSLVGVLTSQINSEKYLM